MEDIKEELDCLGWHALQPIAMKLVNWADDNYLHEKLLEIFPLNDKEQYVGSLANHYRGRLKTEGKQSLVNQMCNNSLRRLILCLYPDWKDVDTLLNPTT